MIDAYHSLSIASEIPSIWTTNFPCCFLNPSKNFFVTFSVLTAKFSDPAIDLGVMAAVLSSNGDMPIDGNVCMAGEVGLSGEIRPVSRIEQRIAEAQRLGFRRMILPAHNMNGINPAHYKIELVPVRRVVEAVRELFG